MTQALHRDPRRTAARPDLAAAALRGTVEAPRYVEGIRRQVTDAVAPLRRRPSPDGPLDTELLYGETVVVYDEDAEGWSWVQADVDAYVGYVPSASLGPVGNPATHKVATLRTYLYPGPSIKLPPLKLLSMGSRLVAGEQKDRFVSVGEGFVFADHLADLAVREEDPVSVAERFVGVPYLWGGRTTLGCDCSGLVQQALAACGVEAPRDSDMQERELGEPVDIRADLGGLRRGDLVFWKGHVGLMRDPATLLHATGRFMLTVTEPLDEACRRILAAGDGPVTTIRRLNPQALRP